MKFPEKGLNKDELLARMEDYRADDLDWRDGRTWAYVYDAGEQAEQIGKQAYMMFLGESGLDPTAFPSLLRFENELVAMSAAHVNGDADVVGNFTSGGTESIILAVKSARDCARVKHPEITEPEMILPVTAHAAFHKAAHYLGIKKVLTPVDPVTFKADVDAIAKAITPNTIMLVGSAPSYAHGVIDPMEEIGKLAQEHDLWYHVDACMGGFLLPYFRRLGEDIPPFDFSIPGVSSLSMDLHKYGYAPKNASIILYRNKDLRRHQIYACSEWTGYTIINNAVQSSKSGGPLAAAWATVNFLGDDGYFDLARRSLEATKKIVAGIKAIPELRMLGEPQMCLVCFASDEINVFHLIDEMKTRGWFLQAQLAYDCSPQNVHISINAGSLETVEPMLNDLRECVQNVKGMTTGDLADSIRQMFTDFDPAMFTPEVFANMLDMAGMNGIELPERMAEINEVLNALPAPLREKLLIEFFNDLFHHREE